MDKNLIKEIEELKLKQKLLIETLNKKKKDEMSAFLFDINSKLDFLVKVFKDAEEKEKLEEENNDSEEEVNLKEKFDDVAFKFSDLDEKLIEIKDIVSHMDKSYNEKLNFILEYFEGNNSNKDINLNNKQKISETESLKLIDGSVKIDSLPPEPDFQIDESLKKVENVPNDDEINTKKKSFFNFNK